MKKLRRIVQEYFFDFSAKEANGFIVLMVLAGLLLFVPTVLRFFPQTASTPEERFNDEALTAQVLKELEEAEKANQKKKPQPKYDNKKKQGKFVFEPFAFNPNEIGVKEWEKLGLKTYLAQRIEKYKAKGGSFTYKSDLQKIYGLPDWLYLKLEPYILLPEKYDSESQLAENEIQDKIQNKEENSTTNDLEKSKIVPTSFSKKYAIEPFDINSADTATLRQVRGVGAVLSQRIVKFRDNLGGFHSLEQIRDVYGLKPETQTELLKYAQLESSGYQKIKINKASLDELKKHPYIRYKLAKVIVNYRTQHGEYQSVADLKKIRVLDKEMLQKITPYLSFE